MGANLIQVRSEDDRRVPQPLPDLRDSGPGVGEIRLTDHHQDMLDAESQYRGEMFLGLRHPAFGGGDDEHHRRRCPNACEHVRDEALVARHVDECEPPAVDLGPREAEVDGQAAALLLGEPVRPHAGEAVNQRRLAVVDMTRGRYDVHARTAWTTNSSSAPATVRRSSRQRPASRRPTTAGEPVRSGAA